MFWVDKIVEDIKKDLKDSISSGRELIVRDEKTASGRVHVGSMRGMAIHSIIASALNNAGIKAKFLFEINDFDPMDGLPVYLDKKKYSKYMGMPLCNIPSPDGKAKNFAEFYAREFTDVIESSGFDVSEFPRSSERYFSGEMDDLINTALLNADVIRKIYKDVSNSIKDEEWMPIHIVCEECGKIGTTKAISFDGKKVTYKCEKKMVEWAEGCGNKGVVSPFGGNAKLPWKVEWAAKFKVYNVDIEGAGKDHSTKGGARDVSNRISKDVFEYTPPFDIPYEFFLIGGKKMSSSKGAGASAKEIADLLPPHIFRLALLGKRPNRTVEFTPDGDTIPLLFDRYDQIADKYFAKSTDDDVRLFEVIHNSEKIEKRFLPRFSQVAFISQIPSIDNMKHVEEMKGDKLAKQDKAELEMRIRYAENWISKFSPPDYVFEIQEKIPKETNNFSSKQKKALGEVLKYVQSVLKLSGQETHAKLHDIRKEADIEAKDFFEAIYISILGKNSGPKAGWFLSLLRKSFLEKRLKDVSK